MEDKLFLKVDEAAEMIGCKRSHLYELLRSGEIVSVTLGRSRRVPVSVLKDYANRKVAEATAELARST